MRGRGSGFCACRLPPPFKSCRPASLTVASSSKLGRLLEVVATSSEGDSLGVDAAHQTRANWIAFAALACAAVVILVPAEGERRSAFSWR